jgi:hypothetical protein
MKHEALIKRLEVSCLGLDAVDPLRLLVNDVVAALAQPEQEPVARHIGWLVRNSQGKLDLLTELQIVSRLEKYEQLHKLYTHPPQRTEENT